MSKPIRESQLLQAVLQFLLKKSNSYDLYFFRLNSGKIKVEDQEKSYYVQLAPKGSPDIIVLYQGKFIALECKSKYGKQSIFQKAVSKIIIKCGGSYHLITSLKQIKDIFA